MFPEQSHTAAIGAGTVLVGSGIGVLVGSGMGVFVGNGMGVFVGGTEVGDGGTGVLVDGIDVLVGI